MNSKIAGPVGFATLLRRPSAYLPLAISFVSLMAIILYVVVYGVVRHADEGAPARLFQLAMLVQAFIIGFFALTWVPRYPGPALQVLAVQVAAAFVPIGLLLILEG